MTSTTGLKPTDILSAEIAHVPRLEGFAENQRPKTNNHRELRLYHYCGTDLYQWFSKREQSIFYDPCNMPFIMRFDRPSVSPTVERKALEKIAALRTGYDNLSDARGIAKDALSRPAPTAEGDEPFGLAQGSEAWPDLAPNPLPSVSEGDVEHQRRLKLGLIEAILIEHIGPQMHDRRGHPLTWTPTSAAEAVVSALSRLPTEKPCPKCGAQECWFAGCPKARRPMTEEVPRRAEDALSADGKTVTLPAWCAKEILDYCDAEREGRAALIPIGSINWLRPLSAISSTGEEGE